MYQYSFLAERTVPLLSCWSANKPIWCRKIDLVPPLCGGETPRKRTANKQTASGHPRSKSTNSSPGKRKKNSVPPLLGHTAHHLGRQAGNILMAQHQKRKNWTSLISVTPHPHLPAQLSEQWRAKKTWKACYSLRSTICSYYKDQNFNNAYANITSVIKKKTLFFYTIHGQSKSFFF